MMQSKMPNYSAWLPLLYQHSIYTSGVAGKGQSVGQLSKSLSQPFACPPTAIEINLIP